MTKDIVLLLFKMLAGGGLVVLFAVVSDAVKPKMFAGLFSAAPSVATASLLVIGIVDGASKDHRYAFGMMAGAVGLVFFSIAAALFIKHLGSVAGSGLAWVGWAAPAFGIWWMFMR